MLHKFGRIEKSLFIWRIENFPDFSLVRDGIFYSPVFSLYFPHRTTWHLKFYSKNTHKCKNNRWFASLVCDSYGETKVEYEIAILSPRGKVLSKLKEIRSFIKNEESVLEFDPGNLKRYFSKTRYQYFVNIHCTISISVQESIFEIHDKRLSIDFKNLYLKKKYQDFAIQYEGKKFPAHRVLLYNRVPRISEEIETLKSTIMKYPKLELSIQMKVLEALLEYIYTDELDPRGKCKLVLRKLEDICKIINMGDLLSQVQTRLGRNQIFIRKIGPYAIFMWSVLKFRAGKLPLTKTIKMRDHKFRLSLIKKKVPCYKTLSKKKVPCYKMLSKKKVPYYHSLELVIKPLSPAPTTTSRASFQTRVICRGKEQDCSRKCTIRLQPDTRRCIALLRNLDNPCVFKRNRFECDIFDLILELHIDCDENCMACLSSNPNLYRNYVSKRLPNLVEDLLNINYISDEDKIWLRVDQKCICVSKTILCARSPVFDAMFSHDMLERRERTVKIGYVDYSTLYKLVTYINCGIILNLKNVSECIKLLIAAHMYILESAVNTCVEYLIVHTNEENICQIYSVAYFLELQDLECDAFSYLYEHFDRIKHRKQWKVMDGGCKKMYRLRALERRKLLAPYLESQKVLFL
ncbi:hypothetical protein NPIL_232701 [Nephila pilipes]|uniref:BTB domain-containing protein n=1 Tax=Nephila pilipes TaxID=299642 RepID=A0A8X6QQR3_NEPPI|nr:hypothetical protein NPIL_232701 [Nephila pilipes]